MVVAEDRPTRSHTDAVVILVSTVSNMLSKKETGIIIVGTHKAIEMAREEQDLGHMDRGEIRTDSEDPTCSVLRLFFLMAS